MKKNHLYLILIVIVAIYSFFSKNKPHQNPEPAAPATAQPANNASANNGQNSTKTQANPLNLQAENPVKTQSTGQAIALPKSNTCEAVLADFNHAQLDSKIQNTEQLATTIRSLRKTGQLPPYYVTKNQAQRAGWSPGTYFNDIPALKDSMIGGDRFSNFEKRLPSGSWTEADLDYVGKKRNAKRLVFSNNQQYITVDHYESFQQVPACQ